MGYLQGFINIQVHSVSRYIIGIHDKQLTVYFTGINLSPGLKNYGENSTASGKKLGHIASGVFQAFLCFGFKFV